MSDPKPWRPALPDRGGLGEAGQTIQAIVKEIEKTAPDGVHEDAHECKRLMHRLDKEREKLCRRYPDIKPHSQP